jgi:D-alanyl-D-alanine carboxypeptidase
VEGEKVLDENERLPRLPYLLVAASLLLLVGLLPAAVSAAASPPEARLASLLPKGARWALVVLDRESGRERLAWGNSLDTSLVPGSVVKLVITGAVLDAVEKGEIVPETIVGAGTGRGKRGKAFAEAGLRLDRYLRQMNVLSVNRMAEHLFQCLGEERFGQPATSDKGARVIARYLAGFDLPAGGLAVVDGSGLSRQDLVTARAMASYLEQVTHRPWFPRFLATLPRPGVEGTVRDLGYVNRRFRVKTGSLDDAFSLAGFAADRNGRKVVFVFLVNLPAKATDRRHSRGYLLKLLAEGDFLFPK